MVREPIRLQGTALHAGTQVAVRLTPSRGELVLARGGVAVPIDALSVRRTDFGVTVGTDDDALSVDLVEHLFAALGGLGVRRGLTIEVEGDELPLLDGGAATYASALRPRFPVWSPPCLTVARAGQYEVGGSTYRFSPGRRISLDVTVTFPPPVGREHARWDGNPDDFCERIAPARTFGWLRDAPALARLGRARGVDLGSVLVFTDDGVLPACPAATPDECARHKLLDLCGDLALYGGPPEGEVVAIAPGHGATHAVVRRALAEGVLARVATTALALLAFAVLSPASARAEELDPATVLDPPKPPTLPDLSHPDLSLSYQYTGATIEPNTPAGAATSERAYAWFAHAELEAPLVPREWYVGAANDVVSGAVPGTGRALLLGNPELWMRGVWWNLSGLASGATLGLVLPVPRDLTDEEAEVLRTVRVVRLWDSAYFNDLTLTARPSFDIRHVTGPFIFQFRQGLDWSYGIEDERGDLTARATFYFGYRPIETLGLGFEVWEVYELTADVDDDERASVSLSPSVRLMLPVVQPAVSFLMPVATPLRGEAASYLAARIHVGFDFDVWPDPVDSSSDRH
jgi:UDP-3-O-acyl-N-acetylglucosamine deacetylase